MDVYQVWDEIRKLKGWTLKTLDRRKSFTVVAVTDTIVAVLLQSTGKERPISREGVENAYRYLIVTGRHTLTEIENDYAPRNPVYVAAILEELPGMKVYLNPIRHDSV